VAGALAASFDSSGVAAGAGVDVGVVNKNTRATVGRGSQIRAGGDISITTDSDEDILSVAASIGGGSGVGISGSFSVYVLGTTTRASTEDGSNILTPGARLDAGDRVSVRADGQLDFIPVAGSLAISGSSAGVGLSNTTLVHNDTVEARIGDRSTVVARGWGASVVAHSSEDVTSVAAAGSGASSAGVAGSATVNILNETTLARIGNGVSFDVMPSGLSLLRPDVLVQADDTTNLITVAGSVGGGGSGGVGAGAAVTKTSKVTEASIGSAASGDVRGDLQVLADSVEDVVSIAAAAGAGGSVGIAGSAGVLVADVVTRAFVGDDPSDATASLGAGGLHVRGSGQISANDMLDVTNIVGTIAVGGAAGVGAAVGVPVVTKRVESFVGAGQNLRVDGQSTLDIRTGDFSIGFQSAPEKPGNVDIQGGHKPTKADAAFGPPDVGQLTDSDQDGNADGIVDTNHDGVDDRNGDPMYGGVRVASLATQGGFSGLSITATNRDSVKNFAMAAGGAATAAVSVAAGVNVFGTTTRA
ncbi:MAG: hypothetical protein KDH48_22030, partial [Rhodoferax sp.]|nr:hypothetical protein [Rhodoferax sp.]